jgi:hypothetical protein
MVIFMAKRRKSKDRKKDRNHLKSQHHKAHQHHTTNFAIFVTIIIVIMAIFGGYYFYIIASQDTNDSEPLNFDEGPAPPEHFDNPPPSPPPPPPPPPQEPPDEPEPGPEFGNRVVLIETFTSVDCYWCNAEEEPALKKIAEDFNRSEVIILAYHGFYGNDPYETEEGNGRASYYGGISGTPSVWFDGTYNKIGGTGQGVDAMYDVFVDYIAQRAPLTSPVTLTLDGTISNSTVKVNVNIDNTLELDPTDLYLRLALIEDGLQQKGKTYDWVMRDYIELSLATSTFPLQLEDAFELDSSWSTPNLRVIGWVQDDTDREVHQSVYFDLN